MAQKCPFLLLFALLLTIKESIGSYQNSVKLILCSTVPTPHPISRAAKTQPWFQLTNTSCFLGKKPASAQVVTLS